MSTLDKEYLNMESFTVQIEEQDKAGTNKNNDEQNTADTNKNDEVHEKADTNKNDEVQDKAGMNKNDEEQNTAGTNKINDEQNTADTNKNDEKTEIDDNLLIDIVPQILSTATTFSSYPSDLHSIDKVISDLQPEIPLYCIRPKVIESAANLFVSSFPGRVLYAAKCNTDPYILQMLWQGGIRHFDCASLGEIELIYRHFPLGKIHFMHPLKTKNSIRKAYFDYGIRDFSLDSIEELNKIIEATASGSDLGLFIRVELPKGIALHDLSGKYGASVIESINILRQARPIAKQLGICFHVGSQCLEPQCYEHAFAIVSDIISQANVKIDVIDAGGGFPASYPGSIPPSLDLFFLAIKRGFDALNLPEGALLWCEPGRALVSAACSLVVKVMARKNHTLYINDGIYGNLADAGPLLDWRFPVRLVRPDQLSTTKTDEEKNFTFYGPTCDSLDFMDGPFVLPNDVKVDDYIEIGQFGAYNSAFRTSFNGFGETMTALVNDDPLMITPGY
ncbi:unnamed protein product [Didymodactylos carnosus]|uniref:ornithine decarboxylase n=1 Tax=Didymodactylos carnosus TaxID=1234261 RepID=A0A814S8V1_9BILA|nr:unnamed protein product [Didymodactylos carnosus]CAF3907424.1 unnamed protein product [Didymodactylos carnosus]